MKNFTLITISTLIAITLFSCKKDSTKAQITIDSTSLDTDFLNAIPSGGGSGKIKFETSLNWNIVTSDTKASTWLEVTPTSGAAGSVTITIKAPKNSNTQERNSIISIQSGSASETINITQAGRIEDLELIAFYNATEGENWTNNTNWNSDKPLSTWHGVTIVNNKVTRLELKNNNLKGSIPTEMGNLTKLINLDLNENLLTGSIPTPLMEYWRKIINQKQGYGFDLTGVALPGIKENIIDINGQSIDLGEIYTNNKYTVFLNWDANDASSTSLIINKLIAAYQQKRSNGLDIIAHTPNNADNFIEQNGMGAWTNFNSINNPEAPTWTGGSPTAEVIDKNGNIVFSYIDNKDSDSRLGKSALTELTPFIEERLGPIDFSADYESTDYSKDGTVLTMQTATTGAGINLVIVGDAFLDKDMGTNGKYEKRMREAMEHFFSEEPYKSFRNRYNVYTIKAISQNEVYNASSQTIFECNFGNGTLISGNDSKVFEYALQVPSITNTENLTVITILNSPRYAGTCYMYYNNAAIAYCPIVYYQDEAYRQIIIHEAGGHGFAKLADEYYYSGTITEAAKTEYQELKALGWQANVDVTNDPSTIQWAHFLSDSRYTSEVGIYEGSLTYRYGAYRPTESSIMRGNIGGFNTPSREAIFKRIITLSGSTYYYEVFATYDAINRSTSAAAYRKSQAATVDYSKFVPLAPPVIIKSSPSVSK